MGRGGGAGEGVKKCKKRVAYYLNERKKERRRKEKFLISTGTKLAASAFGLTSSGRRLLIVWSISPSFMNKFCANFLLPRNYKPKLLADKSFFA